MKIMLETDSIIHDDYAYSYGFHDAGFEVGTSEPLTARKWLAHQSYAYITKSYKTWMTDVIENKPSNLEIPLSTFALPGSHDAGMYELTVSATAIISELADAYLNLDPKAQVTARIILEVVDGLTDKMIERAVKNLALTQKDTITTQLSLGIRHFDFRPGHCFWSETTTLCHQHGFVPGCTLKSFLEQVKSFLLKHPKEIVVTTFSNSGFQDKESMTPTTEELKEEIFKVFRGDIIIGDRSDMDTAYGNLLLDNKRFIWLNKSDLAGSYEDDVYQTLDPKQIIDHLEKQNFDTKGNYIQLQGTASGITSEIARTVVTFSDASSVLLGTKALFDSKLYPWINENWERFPHDKPLIFINDFVDNQLVEHCAKMTQSRIRMYDSTGHPHVLGVHNEWLNVYDLRVFGGVPDYQYDHFQTIDIAHDAKLTTDDKIICLGESQIERTKRPSFTVTVKNNTSSAKWIYHDDMDQAGTIVPFVGTLVPGGYSKTVRVYGTHGNFSLGTKGEARARTPVGDCYQRAFSFLEMDAPDYPAISSVTNTDERGSVIFVTTPTSADEELKCINQSYTWFMLTYKNYLLSAGDEKYGFDIDLGIKKFNVEYVYSDIMSGGEIKGTSKNIVGELEMQIVLNDKKT
ncbi:MAG: hypothetical protein JKY27_02765 [Magnetovibrio sp.]|nr:hypothetical protein [Magnetovibrio sp.]